MLYLHGEINEDSTSDFIKELDKTKGDIIIDIMSDGGCWYSAVAIYNKLISSNKYIITIGNSFVSSAASIIIVCGNERKIYKNSTILVHDGIDTLGEMRPSQVKAVAAQRNKDRELMYRIYAKHTNKTVRFWRNRCASEFYFDARKALELEFIDSVI